MISKDDSKVLIRSITLLDVLLMNTDIRLNNEQLQIIHSCFKNVQNLPNNIVKTQILNKLDNILSTYTKSNININKDVIINDSIDKVHHVSDKKDDLFDFLDS